MEKLTVQDILTATNGVLVGNHPSLSQTINHIDTDSRNLHPQALFIALVGERFNAHDFIEELSLSQTSGFVISQDLPTYRPDKFYIKVENTHNALGDLAKYYRERFDIPVISVTGSVGKTTAKDMISAVLSNKYVVHKTNGNFNNTIGLPLTLFQLNHSHEICVLEMGMDTAGEIDYLSRIAQPDFAVITNIGDAHIQRLGSRENILQAKLEVLPHIKKQGTLLLNGDDNFLCQGAKHSTHSKITVGKDNSCDYRGKILETNGENSSTCEIHSPKDKYTVTIPALGEHMIYPTQFALAIAEALYMSTEEIIQGISNFIPTKMRMNHIKLDKNITFLDDTYNANPQSMKAALEVLSQHTGNYKIAILGDMFELGDYSQEKHLEIGTIVAEKELDILVTVGEMSRYMGEGAVNQGMKKVFICEDKEQAFSLLKDIIPENTTLLCKASRGMALETLVQSLVSKLKEKNKQS